MPVITDGLVFSVGGGLPVYLVILASFVVPRQIERWRTDESKLLLPCRLLDTTHRWRQFALWNWCLTALSASALIILSVIAVFLYHLVQAHLWLTLMVSPDAFSEHAGAPILMNVGADKAWLLFFLSVPIGAVHGLMSGIVLNAALNIVNTLVMFSIYAVNENGMVKPWELGEQQWTPALFGRIRTWNDLFIVTNYVSANHRPGFLRRYQLYASATGTLPTTGHLDAGEVARAWGEGDSAALFETFQRAS